MRERGKEERRTFAQRNVNEIPDGLLLSTVAATESYGARCKEKRFAARCSLARTERSVETTGAFIFRSPGRRRIRWCFPRECKSSRVYSLSPLSALSLAILSYLFVSSYLWFAALLWTVGGKKVLSDILSISILIFYLTRVQVESEVRSRVVTTSIKSFHVPRETPIKPCQK